MIQAVPDILARIVEQKRRELEAADTSREALEIRAAAATQTRRDFRAALTSHPRAIIAEIKKASPSKGVLAHTFEPAAIAREYLAGRAACLSVLTDREFFQGGLPDLETARAAVTIPVLRKDFTISEYHVVEAAAHGADAILLIAAILTTHEMRAFREFAAQYRMAAIVEVHSDDELTSALDSGAEIVGVNNRDLRSFTVSLETSVRLGQRIPANVVRVAESGIHSPTDIVRLESAGFHAFLVGEHLMKSGEPRAALESLLA